MAEKKPEAAPAAAPAAAGGAASAAPSAPAGGGIKAFVPVILAVLLAPALTWGVAQFVLLPKLQATLAAAVADPAAEGATGHAPAAKPAAGHAAAKPAKGGHGAKEGEAAAVEGFRFENIVVNLSGTMGTRYLKTSFLVTGAADIVPRFDAVRPQLGDTTLAVLSSLSLADLEEPGSKNIIRERLVAAYNQVLGAKVAENLFFSDFVVQ